MAEGNVSAANTASEIDEFPTEDPAWEMEFPKKRRTKVTVFSSDESDSDGKLHIQIN